MTATRFIITCDTANANALAEVVLRGLLKVLGRQYGAKCIECKMDEVEVKPSSKVGTLTRPDPDATGPDAGLSGKG